MNRAGSGNTGASAPLGSRGKGRPRGCGNANGRSSRGGKQSRNGSQSTSRSERANAENSKVTGSGNEKKSVIASRTARGKTKTLVVHPTGYEHLVELQDKNAREIIFSLQDEGISFYRLLNSTNINADFIVVILKLLYEVAKCPTCPQSQFALLKSTMSSNLYTKFIPRYMVNATQDRVKRLRLPQTVAHFSVLCRKLLSTFPNRASRELGIAFGTCKDVVRRNAKLGLGIDDNTCAEFLELDNIRIKILNKYDIEARGRNTQEGSDVAQPSPDDFRSMTVTPTFADIHEILQPFLRPNVVGGKFEDVEHYLDVHFRLMREDFIAPLRVGLISYLTLVKRGLSHNVIQHDIMVYHNVRISNAKCTPQVGFAYQLNFNVKKLKRMNWAATERLLFGSLVCLSSNTFHTFLLATVVERDSKQLQKGFLTVRFIQNEGLEVLDLNPNEDFTMIESPAYFEAYSPILKGLQSIKEETLPLRRYIVDAATDLATPKYLRRSTKILLAPLLAPEIREKRSSVCELFGDTSWPTAEDMRLDVAQFRALKHALTHEIAIIQGPPGTGKTFLGLKIMELLLSNMEEWTVGRSPILVTCFTNHALDQFLEGILEFAPKSIARVGGQSMCKALEPFNMSYLRKSMNSEKRVPEYVEHSRARLYSEMDRIMSEIKKIACIIKESETTILHEKVLEEFGDSRHFSQLRYSLDGLKKRPNKWCSMILYWLGLHDVDDMETHVGERNSKTGSCRVPNSNGVESKDFKEEVEDLLGIGLVNDYGDVEKLLKLVTNAARAADRSEHAVTAVHKGDKKAALLDPKDHLNGWQEQSDCRKRKNSIPSKIQINDRMDEAEARNIKNVKCLSNKDRWRLYRYWVSKLRTKKAHDVQALQMKYEICYKQLQEVFEEMDIAILLKARVIGMTTTGAAKNRKLLKNISPKIVIVEEAAEVLESHIVTALTKDCQHLILIGDQQQLRPNPNVYKLAKDYNLDVSLFERLIKNGVAYERLTLQHRMRPRIAALLVPHFYPDLKNDKSVHEYENVKGVDANVFFINHSHHETTVQDSTSRANEFEAKFLVALCRYLLMQGYKSSQITILTTYLGQLCLFNTLTKNTIVANVHCTVVDNYQGEENDIVLLSLVRSNEDGQVGFLKVDNRICVALSRAKKGLYCIGNFDFLEENATTWKAIVASMRQDNLVGPRLMLRCPNHPQTVTEAGVAEDFSCVPEGGCQIPCDYCLLCGHMCPKVCHAYDRDHLEVKCMKICDKILCEKEHRCRKKCYEKCGECQVLVSKVLPCGHNNKLQCYRNPLTAICHVQCVKTLSCGHPCKTACGNICNRMDCVEIVQRKSLCEHPVYVPCNRAEIPEFLLKPCNIRCEETLPCGHCCSGNCSLCYQGRMHMRCNQICGRSLICSHRCTLPCAVNCPPCLHICENRCTHSNCPYRCGMPCKPCMNPCTWKCQHYACTKLCHEPCNRPPCEHPCKSVLKCGHPCIGLCGEPCPPLCRVCDKVVECDILFGNVDEEDERFVFLEDCRHVIESKTMDAWMHVGGEAHDASIRMKVCPRCKTTIKHNLRYGTVIKTILKDVMTIKSMFFANVIRIMENYKALYNDVIILKNSPCHFTSCVSQLIVDIYRAVVMGPNEIVVLQNKVHFLKVMEKMWKKCHDAMSLHDVKPQRGLTACFAALRLSQHCDLRAKARKAELHDQNILLEIMNKIEELAIWHQQLNLFSTSKQIYDFSRQLKRVSHLSAFLMINKGRKLDSDAKALYNSIYELLVCCQPFSEGMDERVECAIGQLCKLMPGLVISETESIQIVNAVGLMFGDWRKCPNGPIYASADCSVAMLEEKYSECKTNTGG